MFDNAAVTESVQGARDRLQMASHDLAEHETSDAIYCVMRAVNHLAVAIDLIANPEQIV